MTMGKTFHMVFTAAFMLWSRIQSKRCFPFQPIFLPTRAMCVCVCECAHILHECVSGCHSVWQECSSSHRKERIKSDNVTDVSRRLWLHQTEGIVVLWPFPTPSTHLPLSLLSHPDRLLPSLPVILAHLLGSLSVCFTVKEASRLY